MEISSCRHICSPLRWANDTTNCPCGWLIGVWGRECWDLSFPHFLIHDQKCLVEKIYCCLFSWGKLYGGAACCACAGTTLLVFEWKSVVKTFITSFVRRHYLLSSSDLSNGETELWSTSFKDVTIRLVALVTLHVFSTLMQPNNVESSSSVHIAIYGVWTEGTECRHGYQPVFWFIWWCTERFSP